MPRQKQTNKLNTKLRMMNFVKKEMLSVEKTTQLAVVDPDFLEEECCGLQEIWPRTPFFLSIMNIF